MAVLCRSVLQPAQASMLMVSAPYRPTLIRFVLLLPRASDLEYSRCQSVRNLSISSQTTPSINPDTAKSCLHTQKKQLHQSRCTSTHLKLWHRSEQPRRSDRQIIGKSISSPSSGKYDCPHAVHISHNHCSEQALKDQAQSLQTARQQSFHTDIFTSASFRAQRLAAVNTRFARSSRDLYVTHSTTATQSYTCGTASHKRVESALRSNKTITYRARARPGLAYTQQTRTVATLMSSGKATESEVGSTEPAQHKPLVVGLTKPKQDNMASTTDSAAASLNEEIKQNVAENTESAAPAAPPADGKSKQKKEKAPKQPKAAKPAPVVAPTSPALIDLRVGHILRAIAHPNADSLYVSTIAMGDPEGTEHTQVDEETGKVVRTVCSGLRAYIPLEEMQDRKIIVVANLKPVNMRSIKSAAMVLAASPKQEEGADPHAPDRTVELVVPPTGSEAGDKVYFEGWPYGEGKGPEKQLNPKKKQWEAIQPGFYTSEDLKVGFDASACEEVEGTEKGLLVVEGKGQCTVPTLKGAVVR